MAHHVWTFVDVHRERVLCLVNEPLDAFGRYEIGMQEAIGRNLSVPGTLPGGGHPLRIPLSGGVEAAVPTRTVARMSIEQLTSTRTGPLVLPGAADFDQARLHHGQPGEPAAVARVTRGLQGARGVPAP